MFHSMLLSYTAYWVNRTTAELGSTEKIVELPKTSKKIKIILLQIAKLLFTYNRPNEWITESIAIGKNQLNKPLISNNCINDRFPIIILYIREIDNTPSLYLEHRVILAFFILYEREDGPGKKFVVSTISEQNKSELTESDCIILRHKTKTVQEF